MMILIISIIIIISSSSSIIVITIAMTTTNAGEKARTVLAAEADAGTTPNLPTNILHFGGFDSSIILF